MSCYPIINWVVFEFVICDSFIICVVFELTNMVENLLLTRVKHYPRTRIVTPL